MVDESGEKLLTLWNTLTVLEDNNDFPVIFGDEIIGHLP